MIDLFRKSLTNVLGTPRREYSCTRSYHYNRNMCIRNGFFNQDTGTHEFIAKFWNVTEKEWWIFLNYNYIYIYYIYTVLTIASSSFRSRRVSITLSDISGRWKIVFLHLNLLLLQVSPQTLLCAAWKHDAQNNGWPHGEGH